MSQQIIISLTTIPSRISNIDTTIKSLLKQSYPPNKIVLNIPIRYKRFHESVVIPEHLYFIESLIINRCQDNGPATKIIGLYANKNILLHEDDIIIICDDDREYHNDFVKNLVNGVLDKPECCVTNAGWDIETLSPYTYQKTNLPRGIEYKKSGYIDILGGCCGFALLYKIFSSNNEFLTVDSAAFFVDDVWISGHLAVQNTKIWMLDNGTDATRTVNDNIDPLANSNRTEYNTLAINYFIKKYKIWMDETTETKETKETKETNETNETNETPKPTETPKSTETKEIFENIYKNNYWNGGSGPGSRLEYNTEYMKILQRLFVDLDIKSIVDIGCGDWQFSRYLNFGKINYIGLDVVEDVVKTNNKLFGKTNIQFKNIDIIQNIGLIENTDLIILKDVVQHWPTKTIIKVVNELRIKTKYILLTNCCHQQTAMDDILIGEWRPLSHAMYPLQLFNPIFIQKYNSKEILLVKGGL